MARVVVVGAGISGLAVTFNIQERIRELGLDAEVSCLEASDRPGGRMITLERRGDRVDVGAQFFHTDFRHPSGRQHADLLAREVDPIVVGVLVDQSLVAAQGGRLVTVQLAVHQSNGAIETERGLLRVLPGKLLEYLHGGSVVKAPHQAYAAVV